MVGTDYKNFYTNYAYDYHIYKLGVLNGILKNSTAFNEQFLVSEVSGLDETDFMRFLKMEIRMTCFHAIETLFELIFALEPKDGKCRDLAIMHTISTADFQTNYWRIARIANDDSELDFLDIPVPDYNKDPLWMHIFYFHPEFDKAGVTEALASGRVAIKKFLKEVATTFSNRDEYNAYKHGIRALNTIQSFEISDTDGSNAFSSDLSDSVSFITVIKEKKQVKGYTLNVKKFNTGKDVKMTHLCSELITSIITRRQYILAREENQAPVETKIFQAAAVDEMIGTHPPINGLGITNMALRYESKK